MKKLFISCQTDIDMRVGGEFKFSYRNVIEGLPKVSSLLEGLPFTVFSSRRSWESVKSVGGSLDVQPTFYYDEWGKFWQTAGRHEGVCVGKDSTDISAIFCNCIDEFNSFGFDHTADCFCVGGCCVDLDVMDCIAGLSSRGIKYSVSTAPTLYSDDGLVDHRLYPNTPWDNNGVLEVPFSIFEGDARFSAKVTPGVVHFENLMEILRVCEFVHLVLETSDFVVGTSMVWDNKDLEYRAEDYLKLILHYASGLGYEIVSIRDLSSYGKGPLGV